MAVVKMQKISICALKKNRKAILEKLQSLGVLEIGRVLDEDADFRRMDTVGKKQGFEKAAASVDQSLEILDRYIPEEHSMFAALEGKKLITPEEGQNVQEERRELLKTAKLIYDLDREHAEQFAAITKLMNSIESLTLLEMVLVSMAFACVETAIFPQGKHWGLPPWRTGLWAVLANVFYIGSAFLFGWFAGIPAWGGWLLAALLEAGLFAMWYALLLETRQDTKDLNRSLKEFQGE